MIQLHITRTAKKYSGEVQIYDKSQKDFSSLADAKQWLKDEYGTSKRVPMFVDDKQGKSKKVGYIYSYKNYEYEDGKKYNYIEQHWVSFYKLTELTV